jgi:hypothetical protein
MGIIVKHWFLCLMYNIKMITVHKIQHNCNDVPTFCSHKISDLTYDFKISAQLYSYAVFYEQQSF